MIYALPAFDELAVSSYYAKLAPQRGRIIAASAAVVAILSGVGFLGLQWAVSGENTHVADADGNPLVATEANESVAVILDKPPPGLLGGTHADVLPGVELAFGMPLAVGTPEISAANASPVNQPVLLPAETAEFEAAPLIGQDAPRLKVPAAAEQSGGLSKGASVNWIARIEPLPPLAVKVAEAPEIPQPVVTLVSVAVPNLGNLKLPPIDAGAKRPSTMMDLSAATTKRELAPRPIEPLPNLVTPSTALAVLDNAPTTTDAGTFVPAAGILVARIGGSAILPDVRPESTVPAAMQQPPEFFSNQTLAQDQVVFSHWNVRMPFKADLERIRNANTARIASINDDADLLVSGDWIAEGVIIYSFNGKKLADDTPISVHVLKSLHIDLDGHARATVRYRDPTAGILDRGLLAVPVVRELGLADGSLLEARVVDANWSLSVKSVGKLDNGLRVGDVVIGERSTDTVFTSHEDLTESLNTLAARQVDVARLTVQRDGALVFADWRLATEQN
ncbi:MAG: hypothetical protein ACR2OY_12780 [Boseongicola sp.]